MYFLLNMGIYYPVALAFRGVFFSIINASKNHISSVIRTAELSKFCRWDLPKKDNPVSLHDLDFKLYTIHSDVDWLDMNIASLVFLL